MSNTNHTRGITYDYVGSLPFAYTDEMELVYSCSRCRALVMADDRHDHTAWHKLNNDGYDWVKDELGYDEMTDYDRGIKE